MAALGPDKWLLKGFPCPYKEKQGTRWWRSDDPDDSKFSHREEHQTRYGVFSQFRQDHYSSSYKVGYSYAKRPGQTGQPVSGYAGFRPGVYGGNVLGQSLSLQDEAARAHLAKSCQGKGMPKEAINGEVFEVAASKTQ